jgi:carbonic anhydrase
MITAGSALDRLTAGNQRFVDGNLKSEILASPERRNKLIGKQKPFAVILGCSDSRVPCEIVFDHGLGDLFVIRVAGNIAAQSQIGSVEYAVENFGCPLVVVLGHSGCGAIRACFNHLRQSRDTPTENLRAIVDRIRPSIQALLEPGQAEDSEALLDAAVEANVRGSVEQLHQESELLRRRVEERKLLIVGAEYSLETGVVRFFSHSAGGAENF